MTRLPALAAFAAAGFATAAPVPDTPAPTLYFPTRIGDRCVYKFDKAYPATYAVTGVARKGDGWVVTSTRLKDDGLPTTVSETYLVTSAGVASLAGNRPGDGPGERWLLKLPPGNKRPAAGLDWEWGYPDGAGRPVRHHYTFVGEETVEVAAGKFRAVRVEMWRGDRPEEKAQPGRHEVRWYAPRVGVVKAVGDAVSGSTSKMELASFTPGKD